MAKYKIIPSSRTIVQSPISIGHKAEKGVEAIEFDVTAWVETYGSGTLTVIMRRWGDAIPYPIALEIDENNKATWTLSNTDTAKAGMAYAQLSYIVGDEVVKKSDIYTFRVMDSLTGEGEPPEAYESWLEHLTHLAAEAMAEVLDIEGVATDKTLTVDGGIADAKATGDALALKADKSTTYTKTEVDQMISDVEVETDTTLAVSGAPADAAETGRQIGLLKADLEAVNNLSMYNRNVDGYFYPFIRSLKSAGSKDFGFIGVENYDADGAYHHKVTTPNDANTDLLGIKAIGVPALFSGDFTISMWYAADADCFGHPFEYATYVNYNASGSGGESDNVGGNAYFSNLTVHSQRFTAEIQNRVSTSPAFVGLLFWFSQADRRLIFAAYNHNATRLSWVNIFFPNSINTTEWHHYAFTRNGDTLRFFFDGELVLSMSCLASTIYPAGQIAIGNLFEQTLANRKNLTTTKYGEKYKDLYISDECKWVTAFDPTEILY